MCPGWSRCLERKNGWTLAEQAGEIVARARADAAGELRLRGLARSWAEVRDRRRDAGIPQETEFAAKPQLGPGDDQPGDRGRGAVRLVHRRRGLRAGQWLQAWLEERNLSYVMAVRRSDTFTMPGGERRADDLIAAVPPRFWQKISAGAGAHGPRGYHWTRVPVRPGWERGRGHWLLPAGP